MKVRGRVETRVDRGGCTPLETEERKKLWGPNGDHSLEQHREQGDQ